MYAMEINVEKDRKTGDTRILSASAVSPDEVPDHGVKVFDDGRKVVYEVRSGGSSTLDNGVHRWSSQQVDELMKRVGATTGCAQGGKAKVTIKPADADDPKTSPRSTDRSADLPTNYTPYTTPPAVPSSATTAHKMPQAPSTPITTQPPPYREVISEGEVTEAPQATAEKPITMIFMGYHNVDDQDETKRLLGFDGTIKAEIVLIDEDDEKSLREKTVTDGYSTMDGNAADLVSGARPLSDTTDLSSEGKDESSATATKELPSPAVKGRTPKVPMATANGIMPKPALTAMKSSKASEDGDLKRDRTERKSVGFHNSVSVISARGGDSSTTTSTMEVDAHPESCYPSQGLNGQGNKHQHQPLDIEVAHEIAYLDEVLEANCCDPGVDSTPSPSNGTATTEKHPREVSIDGTGPSVNISNTDTTCHEVIVEGRKQTIFIKHQDVNYTNNSNNTRPNGHSGPMAGEQENYRKKGGETTSPTMTTIKKEARFELRAFQEEKKPSKLFDPCEKEVRVKKVRPSEEVAELERERLELIRGQAVKKNPDMGTKWWNPPQEKSLEEELEPDKLESHRKYEERKQQRRSEFTGGMSQTYAQYSMAFDPKADPEPGRDTEDILVEQMDFSTARKQFLQIEHARQQAAERSQVTAPNSAKPFSRSSDTVIHVERSSDYVTVGYSNYQDSPLEDGDATTTTVRTERIYCSPEGSQSPTSTVGRVLGLGQGEPSNSGSKEAWMENRYRDEDFTCARAIMTIIKDEKDSLSLQHRSSSLHSPSASLSSCNPNECDSGLDEQSLRSLDNSMLDTLSKDFSMNNVSDSGASNETMSASYLEETSLGEYSFPSTPQTTTTSLGEYSFPSTPQTTTPVNGNMEGGTAMSPGEQNEGSQGLSEQELEYHAGMLVQCIIQHALMNQNQSQQGEEWQGVSPHPLQERHVDVLSSGNLSSLPTEYQSLTPLDLHSPPPPQLHSPSSPMQQSPTPLQSLQSAPPQYQSTPSPQPLSPPAKFQSSPTQYQSPSPQLQPLPTQVERPTYVQVERPTYVQVERPTYVQMERPTYAPLPQRSSSGGPKILIQSALSRSLALNPDPVPVRTPVLIPPRPIEPYQAPELSRTPSEKDQFSYFSKYSEAAELRSTAAATRTQETEQSTGPFKLRSRKQRTLSMIEEEIRAAQEREKELKKQRLGAVRSGPDPRTNQTGRPKTMTINPGDKHKTNSLPAKLSLSGSLPLTLTSMTAPGKINPPASPSSSENPPASPSSSENPSASPSSSENPSASPSSSENPSASPSSSENPPASPSSSENPSASPSSSENPSASSSSSENPSASSSSSENPSPLLDLGNDDSGGSGRPKNFMQTLMDDYETHKVKRREKGEDNSVLEATRVTRRKSNMALRWEAGLYTNEDGEEEEEEEEE
ncbi:A-kinase anchor protein 2-like [Salvelinus alpinus]|uniref:A-kinase anchor protein 2-like n=1 Tax=Salvelinus alpinus TaxID=8036 RepID=UPI0039FCB926